jgi:hypothetical protein
VTYRSLLQHLILFPTFFSSRGACARGLQQPHAPAQIVKVVQTCALQCGGGGVARITWRRTVAARLHELRKPRHARGGKMRG